MFLPSDKDKTGFSHQPQHLSHVGSYKVRSPETTRLCPKILPTMSNTTLPNAFKLSVN